MARMYIQLGFLLMLKLACCLPVSTKPRLTLDEFFNSTLFSTVRLSPTGEHLLIGTMHPSWNTSSFANDLWIYDIQRQQRKLVTRNLHKFIKPQWSPSGRSIALLLESNASHSQQSIENGSQAEQQLYLYSVKSDDLLPVRIDQNAVLGFTWSDSDLSLYVATFDIQAPKKADDDDEWKDVIRYRHDKEQSTIMRVDIAENDPSSSWKQTTVKQMPFLVGELSHVPSQRKLLVTSVSPLIEDLEAFEIYSIDLQNTSSPAIRLTNNENMERNIKISSDGIHVLFQMSSLGSSRKQSNDTQAGLYALNLINGQMTRLARRFHGNVNEYTITTDGEVYLVGQIGTEVQIYSQRFLSDDLTEHLGWNGTYESITVSKQRSIAFVHSSTEKPLEVYLVDRIDKLRTARAITSDNKLYTERDLPQATVYQWNNADDHRVIEGMLHYPPGKFLSKNLPLLVMIHGGPYGASVNRFSPDWYTWAPLAASQGWLVLEPNYRGSTGYGEEFLQELRYRPLSLAGDDILHGVDQLVRDGIADPYRLSVGGYSYGGFLTNWLITQTKRFNAALSGAGSVDHVSTWGMMDLPVLPTYLFGGFPWETPHIYQNESPLYQLDRVRTPTLITTGENDVRVPTSQSYILERGLYYRGVPVKLLVFPKEGHALMNNPWYGKIKAREELKWLKQYGNVSSFTERN